MNAAQALAMFDALTAGSDAESDYAVAEALAAALRECEARR